LEGVVGDVQKAARGRGLQLEVFRASIPSEIDAAFAAAAQRGAGALMVGIDSFFTIQREQVVALAAHHALPAI
jgi:putative ABC transport system substrate-binding protein